MSKTSIVVTTCVIILGAYDLIAVATEVDSCNNLV